MKKIITHWTIQIKWNDGTDNYVDHIPDYIAKNVDPWLDDLEREENFEDDCDCEELGTTPIGEPTKIINKIE